MALTGGVAEHGSYSCTGFLEGESETAEHLGSHALALGEHPEQKVFGADEVGAHYPGLDLAQRHHLLRPPGESFEHRSSLRGGEVLVQHGRGIRSGRFAVSSRR